MKTILRVTGALLLTSLGCGGEQVPGWPKAGPEVVPADQPVEIPGSPIAGRYWAEIHPGEGRMDLFPLHPGNVIYRGERIVDLNYNYGGTATQDNTCQPGASCVPPGTAVRLFTDQTKITYVDRANGFCHQNGA